MCYVSVTPLKQSSVCPLVHSSETRDTFIYRRCIPLCLFALLFRSIPFDTVPRITFYPPLFVSSNSEIPSLSLPHSCLTSPTSFYIQPLTTVPHPYHVSSSFSVSTAFPSSRLFIRFKQSLEYFLQRMAKQSGNSSIFRLSYSFKETFVKRNIE